MARVGDEAALARKAGVETAEHLVQRLPEAGYLVFRSREWEPSLGGVGRDLLRLSTHRLDRAQRSPCHEVPDHRGDEKRDRQDHEQLGQEPVERLVAIVERLADDDDPIVDRDREQPELRPSDLRLRHDSSRLALGRAPLSRAAPSRQRHCFPRQPTRPSREPAQVLPRPQTTAEVTSNVDAQLDGSHLQRVGDPFVERVSEPDVEDRADRRKHDGHDEREGERQPHPNRKPAHATLSRRSRYPTPRTVSIELRSNGRSTLSRRYLTYTSTTFERFSYA